MTEKNKQIYNAAKNNFNSWPKWKQEYASNFMYSYKEEPELDKTYDKAILVIDMPEGCYECPLAVETVHNYNACCITGGRIMSYGKFDSCPLKKLPEKYDMDNTPYNLDYNEDYERGYNACIDEILGVEL